MPSTMPLTKSCLRHHELMQKNIHSSKGLKILVSVVRFRPGHQECFKENAAPYRLAFLFSTTQTPCVGPFPAHQEPKHHAQWHPFRSTTDSATFLGLRESSASAAPPPSRCTPYVERHGRWRTAKYRRRSCYLSGRASRQTMQSVATKTHRSVYGF